MAKLYFRYGAMNSGKSTSLLQAAYNYEERGQHVLLAKPRIDTKGAHQISSRLGMTRPVDFLIGPDDSARNLFTEHRSHLRYTHDELVGLSRPPADVACLLIDEAQFLTRDQVDDLLRIAVLDDVPVLAYGIRTDFLTEAFPGLPPAARDRPLARRAQDDLPLRPQGALQRQTRQRPVRLRRRPGRDRRRRGHLRVAVRVVLPA